MICIFGPCLELGYLGPACNQRCGCRSFPCRDSLWDAEQVKADKSDPRVDSQRYYSCVWACSPFQTHQPLLVVLQYKVSRSA